MNARVVAAALATAGLTVTPLAGEARVLLLPTCTGGVHMIVLPGDPTAPRERDDHCAKACHAVTDRRAKLPGEKRECC